ncbi:hypothetical protein FRB95_005880 [Tulasnella sp. JGI-2019a]|nr:hypothetical protein FRB95_005880 [Tulasnella sp. JGI-2019a]
MIPATGKRSFTIAVVPSVAEDKVFVNVHIKSLATSEWKRIAAANLKNVTDTDNGFIGIVTALGRDVSHMGFKIGDAVFGVMNGDRVDTLGGGDQA